MDSNRNETSVHESGVQGERSQHGSCCSDSGSRSETAPAKDKQKPENESAAPRQSHSHRPTRSGGCCCGGS